MSSLCFAIRLRAETGGESHAPNDAKEIDMRKLIGAMALALFLLASSNRLAAQDTSKKLTLSEKETPIGKLVESKDNRALSISKDYNHMAMLTPKGDKRSEERRV